MVQMLRQYVATTRRIRTSTWTSSWLHTEPVAIRQLSLLLFNLSMNVKINYQLSCWPLTLDQLTMMEKQAMWKASDKILGRCMMPIEEQVLPKSCNMTSTSTLQTCNLERKCFWRDQLQDQDWPPKLTPKYRRPYTLTCILGKDELNGPTIPGCGRSMWVHLDHLKRACSRKLNNFDWTDEDHQPEAAMNGDQLLKLNPQPEDGEDSIA